MIYHYTIELKYTEDDYCVVSFWPLVHDWMDGFLITESEAGRDGLGVQYLVNLKDKVIEDIAPQACRSRSFLADK